MISNTEFSTLRLFAPMITNLFFLLVYVFSYIYQNFHIYTSTQVYTACFRDLLARNLDHFKTCFIFSASRDIVCRREI